MVPRIFVPNRAFGEPLKVPLKPRGDNAIEHRRLGGILKGIREGRLVGPVVGIPVAVIFAVAVLCHHCFCGGDCCRRMVSDHVGR